MNDFSQTAFSQIISVSPLNQDLDALIPATDFDQAVLLKETILEFIREYMEEILKNNSLDGLEAAFEELKLADQTRFIAVVNEILAMLRSSFQ